MPISRSAAVAPASIAVRLSRENGPSLCDAFPAEIKVARNAHARHQGEVLIHGFDAQVRASCGELSFMSLSLKYISLRWADKPL